MGILTPLTKWNSNEDILPSTNTEVGKYGYGKIYSSDKNDWMIYGPCMPINHGKYALRLDSNNALDGDCIDVVNESGKLTRLNKALMFDKNITFLAIPNVPKKCTSFESRFRTKGNSHLSLVGNSTIPK